ncbi:bifunctional DNA-formamidopyrimidine glycosylase/DNA-(apurinic or apyrimidinic site) lyase [Paradesulfitobacterium ferrireducens]|uniref:bifunctional DNA-formamidopyrimidine glycosylase/DNA-(apurinic or apyrimidinic site) lyase n=1 Tax=Paradesulfitobacterium ferrireducens TaxID=2816476 RepID=UPI001A8FD3BA|nr:bifunctional DNA-formamidopyrimidine glycosylase/DNA-(apurinic or apyrimidinic site) lyase [Paradesulfitobacterium ferrireducens]
MPELPEVETIRRTLAGHITGLEITGVTLYWPGAVRSWESLPFPEIVKESRIQSLDRRGKYLLIHLDNGYTLVAHMRMTGRLLYYPEGLAPARHTHVVFKLTQGELHFNDTRKFGRIQAVPSAECLNISSLSILGPEPLSEEVSPARLGDGLARKKKNLKAALLDQTVVAGLGNIYVDEALFRAGLHPERPASSLTAAELKALRQAIRDVLEAGIQANGTSFRDYRDANGELGLFQKMLKAYGRGGKPCVHCGQPLIRKKVAGRTTVFCEHCQH